GLNSIDPPRYANSENNANYLLMHASCLLKLLKKLESCVSSKCALRGYCLPKYNKDTKLISLTIYSRPNG
ncbi:MAG: hypothetical protein NDP11_06020, partial [Crenarchaeota archaeon]|nr:hypothetical protein [Thermoproteota archaeon]